LLLGGIRWLAEFGNGVKSLEIEWLSFQKTIVGVGISILNMAQQASKAFDHFLGNTPEQQLAGLNNKILDLEESLSSRLAKVGQGGLFDFFYDPSKTDKMRDDLGLLRAEAVALKAGLTDPRQSIFGSEIATAQSFLSGLDSNLASKIASAERIFEQSRENTLGQNIVDFTKSADDRINKWEEAFNGVNQPVDPAGQVSGRDPLLEDSLGELQQINVGIQNLTAGAVAG